MTDNPTIPSALTAFIEHEILPKYDNFDAAHRIDHTQMVITQSLEIARHYPVRPDMVYAIAAFHDLGLSVDRATHHLESGRMVRDCNRLHEWFSPEDIETMAQAVEDHRASSDHEPRSIYGRVVAEADRMIDPEVIVRRTIQYGLANYPDLDREGQWQRTLDHLHAKYAEGGYLRLHFPESPNAGRLHDLRILINDRPRLRTLFDRLYDSLALNNQN